MVRLKLGSGLNKFQISVSYVSDLEEKAEEGVATLMQQRHVTHVSSGT